MSNDIENGLRFADDSSNGESQVNNHVQDITSKMHGVAVSIAPPSEESSINMNSSEGGGALGTPGALDHRSLYPSSTVEVEMTDTEPSVQPRHRVPGNFDDIRKAGPAAPPIRFPPPEYSAANRVDEVLVYNEDSGKHFVAKDVLVRSEGSDSDEESGQQIVGRAYWKIPNKQPIMTRMGHLEFCVVLTRRPKFSDGNDSEDQDSDEEEPDIVFLLTRKVVAVKVNYTERMERSLHDGGENPLNEIAALQIIGNDHPHVLGCIDVLYDSENLSVVMPYCGGGDLFDAVDRYMKANPTSHGLPESQACFWFRQLLEGIRYLQSLGICHRDLSPENVIINENRSLVIDFGMSLLVPYASSECDGNDVTDVARMNGCRRLMTPQGQLGKRRYMSPEIWRNQDDFDGFSIDIWTAGMILFFMLTGQTYSQPFDPVFQAMTTDLRGLLHSWNMSVSPLAIDLLQNILAQDPRKRLTLEEIAVHRWVLGP